MLTGTRTTAKRKGFQGSLARRRRMGFFLRISRWQGESKMELRTERRRLEEVGYRCCYVCRISFDPIENGAELHTGMNHHRLWNERHLRGKRGRIQKNEQAPTCIFGGGLRFGDEYVNILGSESAQKSQVKRSRNKWQIFLDYLTYMKVERKRSAR